MGFTISPPLGSSLRPNMPTTAWKWWRSAWSQARCVEWHKALCVLNAFEAHPHLHHYEASFVYSLAHTWLCLWLMIFTIKGSFLYQIRRLMSEKRFLPRGVLGRKNVIGVASDWGWALSFSNSDSLYGHIPATPCYSPILSSPNRPTLDIGPHIIDPPRSTVSGGCCFIFIGHPTNRKKHDQDAQTYFPPHIFLNE